MKSISKSISKSFRNAVLIKEVQVKSKRPAGAVCMMILNIIIGLSALITMIVINGCIASNSDYSSDVFIGYFTVIVLLEAVMLFFVTPAIAAGAIASERERQTLDVLLTTSMTPWQIIWGKYWSSIANVLVLTISTLPFLSTVFLFGGVSFWAVLWVLICLIGSVMYLGAFGVFMSSLIKKTSTASVLCYLLLLVVTFGSMGLVANMYSIADALNYVVWRYSPQLSGTRIFNADWSVVFLLFSPVTVAYDVLSKAFNLNWFGSSVSTGMGYFIDLITDGRLSANCFISNLWTLLALVAQLLLSYGMLKLSAANLNPIKKRKKGSKNTVSANRAQNRAVSQAETKNDSENETTIN